MRKNQNVKRDDCWKERWEEEERDGKGTVISWSEMMTPSGYPQDATNHQVETNCLLIYWWPWSHFWQPHPKWNNGVNRDRYQVSLELVRALAHCRYPKPPTMWHYHQPNPSLMHCRSSISSYKCQFQNKIIKMRKNTGNNFHVMNSQFMFQGALPYKRHQ